MKDFIGYIVKNLVSKPDAVQVESQEKEEELLYSIRVSQEDIGKVVGSKGKTITALRTIASQIGARLKKRVRIEVLD